MFQCSLFDRQFLALVPGGDNRRDSPPLTQRYVSNMATIFFPRRNFLACVAVVVVIIIKETLKYIF